MPNPKRQRDEAVTPTGPAWAEPYVPEIGRNWTEWHLRTMRGLAGDLAGRNPAWHWVWYDQLLHPAPSGADERTFFAVWPQPMGVTGICACVHFTSWDRTDAHFRRVAGAPLRVAAYPGLWRGGDMIWSFGCHWDLYSRWAEEGSLAAVWRLDAASSFAHVGYPYRTFAPDLARDRAEAMRAGWGWTCRSAMLMDLAYDAHPIPVLPWTDDRDVWQEGAAICWDGAEDDLPWPSPRMTAPRMVPFLPEQEVRR